MTTLGRTIVATIAVSLFGAGCISPIQSPKMAQTLEGYPMQVPVSKNQGFGKLPIIKYPKSTATVRLSIPLPTIPEKVTVMRLRDGAPNDTELINLAASIDVPGGTLGRIQTERDLKLTWKDERGLRWEYQASQRLLQFTNESVTSSPNTVSVLPTNDEIVRIANTFLQDRLIALSDYRFGMLEPDWNLWWFKEKELGRCMDINAVAAMRKLSAADPLSVTALDYPSLSDDQAACTTPEFPGRITVRYRMLYDGRDVVKANGNYLSGMEIAVDVINKTVVAGRMTVYADPERSDYPALTKAQAVDLLQRGGLSGATGDVVITSYDIMSLKLDDKRGSIPSAYLIPSIVAQGTRTAEDGSTEPFRIVVPLISR